MPRVAVLLSIVVIASCDGQPPKTAERAEPDGTPAEAATREPVHVRSEVELTPGAIDPDTLRWRIDDTVRLAVTNRSDQPLEFFIGRGAGQTSFDTSFFAGVPMTSMEGPVIAAERPTGRGPARDSTTMRHPHVYFFLRPDESARATFVVPSDRRGIWEMGCFLDGHYQEGMRGVVVVAER